MRKRSDAWFPVGTNKNRDKTPKLSFLKVCRVRDAPVVQERISNGLTDKLTVLLQGVERVLHRLVDGFLNGATHLLNLVDAATWLRLAPEGCRRK